MTADGPQIGAGKPETPERDGAFPRLDEGQMARLRQLGERRAVEPGEVLFAAGDAEPNGGEGSMAVRLVHQRLASDLPNAGGQ